MSLVGIVGTGHREVNRLSPLGCKPGKCEGKGQKEKARVEGGRETALPMAELLDVAVYAEKHRSGSQIVKAAVVAAPGLEVAGLRAHCVEQLATYKCPQEFVFVAEIPRSSSGKILRTRLPLEGGTAR